jgi:hypothetical protein
VKTASPGVVTARGVRDGDPSALKALCERRGTAVLTYCEELLSGPAVSVAAADAFARFRREVIAARLEDGYLDATTLMEHCVVRGVPMRAAHEAVGKLVRLCEERRCRLADLPPEAYENLYPGLSAGVYKVLGVANALAAFQSAGSTAPAEVERQLREWKLKIAK